MSSGFTNIVREVYLHKDIKHTTSWTWLANLHKTPQSFIDTRCYVPAILEEDHMFSHTCNITSTPTDLWRHKCLGLVVISALIAYCLNTALNASWVSFALNSFSKNMLAGLDSQYTSTHHRSCAGANGTGITNGQEQHGGFTRVNHHNIRVWMHFSTRHFKSKQMISAQGNGTQMNERTEW